MVHRGRLLAAWDGRAPGGARIEVGMVLADLGVRRLAGGYAGRLPALASAGGAALLAWHDGDTIRAARLTSR